MSSISFLSAQTILTVGTVSESEELRGTVVPFTILTGPVTVDQAYREEATLIYDAMLTELEWQGSIHNFWTVKIVANMPGTPLRRVLGADYADGRFAFAGTIDRINSEERSYTLSVWNPDDTSIDPMAQYRVTFFETKEILDLIPFMVWQLTSILPVEIKPLEESILVEDYVWKDKWLYLGLQVGGSVRFYKTPETGTEPIGGSFDPVVRAEVQFLSFYWPGNYLSFSVITGGQLNMDKAVYTKHELGEGSRPLGKTALEFPSTSLSVPLALKVNYKPGPLSFGAYGGAYYIAMLPSEEETGTPVSDFPVGLTFGVETGVHLGPGVLYIDVHYSLDLDKTVFEDEGVHYNRSSVSVLVGYNFGFFRRTKKADL
jgi:hypothetical protein